MLEPRKERLMSNHETVPEAAVHAHQPIAPDASVKPLSPSELRDFLTGVFEQIPVDELDPAKVRYYLAQKSRIGDGLRPILSVFLRPIPPIDLREWQSFFRRVFKLEVILAGIHIPAKPD